jgi:hypothetical protein
MDRFYFLFGITSSEETSNFGINCSNYYLLGGDFISTYQVYEIPSVK